MYFPLVLVFLSGIGVSFQSLFIKVLSEEGFHNTFECIFFRAIVQGSLLFIPIFCDKNEEKYHNFLGETWLSVSIAVFRCVIGFGSMPFTFLALQRLPLGDATVLILMSPVYAAMLGVFFLGEPWRLSEMFAIFVSVTGAVFVIRPPFLFSSDGDTLDPIGVLFCVIASLSAAGIFISIRLLGTTAKVPWKNLCIAQCFAQMLFAVPAAYISGQLFTFNLTSRQMLLIFCTGFVAAFSQSAMTIGLQREVGPYMFVLVYVHLYVFFMLNIVSNATCCVNYVMEAL